MSTKLKKQKRFKLMHDESGHDYIVPTDQENMFDKWVEATENGEETALDFNDYRVNRSGWTFTDPKGY